ncbi:hypothetical protein MRX96_058272 [Rhipicephalus microplus]
MLRREGSRHPQSDGRDTIPLVTALLALSHKCARRRSSRGRPSVSQRAVRSPESANGRPSAVPGGRAPPDLTWPDLGAGWRPHVHAKELQQRRPGGYCCPEAVSRRRHVLRAKPSEGYFGARDDTLLPRRDRQQCQLVRQFC